MRSFRRIASVMAVLLALLLTVPALAAPEDYNPDTPALLSADQLYGTSTVVIDGNTGNILFSKDARVRMYPASTTKIMTLLLAVENGWDLNMEVTIPAEAGDIPSDSSIIPVYKGEKTTFGELLYGMMLHSGNDGANAVAVLVSGSVSAFVDRMNARAAELGCTGTHFANPHGYHDENHYSTALDLALIAQEAMKHEIIREIVSTASYTINVQPRGEIPLRNTNAMIISNSGYYYEDCIGIKTGSHSRAGKCFVGAAEKDGVMLITVTLNCGTDAEKWTDSKRLFEYGFTCYTPYTLEQLFELTSSRIATVRVSNAKSDDPMGGVLELKLAQSSNPEYERMVASGDPDAKEEALNDFVQRAQISVVDNLTAPISEGEFVGSFSYTTQDGEVVTASLIAGRSVEAQPEQTTIYDVFPFLKVFTNPLVLMLIAVLILLVIVLVLYSSAKRRRRERRRQELYERRRREYMQRQRQQAPARRRGNAPPARRSGTSRSGSTARPKRKKPRQDDDDLFGGF